MTEEERFDPKKLHPAVQPMLDVISNAHAALAAFRSNCKHVLVRFGDSIRCQVCGENDFGWWCPKSPDHRCDYPEGEEQCRFCGEPDERK